MFSWGLFVPIQTKASFLSGLFSNDVSANTTQINQNINSQSMGLLEANVSPIAVIQDKKDKDNKIDPNNQINIVSENALLPFVGLDGTTNNEEVPSDISVYVVRKGDSLSQIANMFGVTEDTIRWSNDIKKGQKLTEGDVLFISPVSGVIHTVEKGQTLKGIANLYKVDVNEILGFNDIPIDSKLEVGDELIIPGGEITEKSNTKISAPKNSTKNKDYYKKYVGPDLGGYFTNPVPQYSMRTQNLHGNNSTDLGAPMGTPIVAAAEGTVLLARYGWNGAYGNMVVIKHPNGTETLYSHLSKITTKTGAKVGKGEIIGLVGSTGRSTGPHLHFEVHGARNFTLDLPKYNPNR